ncbi:MAG: amidohydrolase [Desulfobacteraceae bacterium]
MNLLVTNGTVLTMNADMEVITDGSVLVENGCIQKAGRFKDLSSVKADRVVDAKGGIIMPGLVNTHTHASMTLFRGLADDLPLMEWLREHIFPAEAGLTREKVHAGAMLACAEMILSGTTCFCDMYLFEDEVAHAASKAGMRAVVGEVLYDFPSPNYGNLENGFAYAGDMIEKWKHDPLVTVALEPHSPYICAPELLERAGDMARTANVPLVIHVSETMGEYEQTMQKYNRTPVGLLSDLGLLRPNLLACHCVHLSDNDIELLSANSVKVAHCPESNMKLASGVAPVPAMLERGVCVGLGTDGCASNNDLDLFGEMDTAAKVHKVFSKDPQAVNAETAVRMATINGARALGLGSVTGSLEPGKRGDIIVVDTTAPHLFPMYNPYSHLVYSASGNDVTTVIIDGKPVMENRNVLTMDTARIMETVKMHAAEILKNDSSD